MEVTLGVSDLALFFGFSRHPPERAANSEYSLGLFWNTLMQLFAFYNAHKPRATAVSRGLPSVSVKR